uniref:uncharacterized protein LOC127062769 isoform X2 n=1 Tax=Vespula vulgaris TaxID=7454 RepID=UPI00223BEEC7|nr:uncharacterized protein LOC127062769 isoform X2 [Vespula vulgaris]
MTKYEMCVKSRPLMILLVLSVLMMVLIPEPTEARPSGIISRRKRISDQRLAELETLVALSNMKGRMITVPVGLGIIDPAKMTDIQLRVNANRENYDTRVGVALRGRIIRISILPAK